MEWNTIFQFAEAVFLAILGYVMGVLKMLHNKQETVAKELKEHRVEVAEKYLPRSELITLKLEVKALEDRLEKRFDRMEQWMGRRFDVIMDRDDHKSKE